MTSTFNFIENLQLGNVALLVSLVSHSAGQIFLIYI